MLSFNCKINSSYANDSLSNFSFVLHKPSGFRDECSFVFFFLIRIVAKSDEKMSFCMATEYIALASREKQCNIYAHCLTNSFNSGVDDFLYATVFIFHTNNGGFLVSYTEMMHLFLFRSVCKIVEHYFH